MGSADATSQQADGIMSTPSTSSTLAVAAQNGPGPDGSADPPAAANAGASSNSSKQKRRRWDKDHDILGVNAVSAAGGHVASRGTITERFEAAAAIFNAQPQARFTTDGKALRDRFLLLKKNFKLSDTREALRTGHEEEVTPLDKVLVDVVEAADDHKRVEEHKHGEASRREERLVATGEAIRHAAMERRRDRTARAPHHDDEPAEPVGGQEAAPPRSRRRKRRDSDDEDVFGDLQRFEDRRSALAQKKLDLMEKQLKQQREFHAQEMARRDREEQERQRRQERLDVEQRRERTAFLHLMDEVMKRLH